jgi:hypothetical protein
MASPFFTSDEGECSVSLPDRFTPAERALVPVEKEAAWGPKLVWTL